MKTLNITEEQLDSVILKVIEHRQKTLKEQEVVQVTDIQDDLLSIPLELRRQLKDDLQQMLENPADMDKLEALDFHNNIVGLNVDEQISYKGIPEIKATTTIGKLLKWVKRYLTDKATNFLINASMDEPYRYNGYV